MNLLPKPLAYAIMGMVSLVWLGNFVATLVVDGYESDPLIHAAFMGIVGSAIALSRKGPDDPPPTPTPKLQIQDPAP